MTPPIREGNNNGSEGEGSHNETIRGLLSPGIGQDPVGGVDGNTPQSNSTLKGSMKDIKRHKPSLLNIRSNSEVVQNSKFFTSEGTPLRNIKTSFKLDEYERRKTKQLSALAKELQ